MFLLPCTWTVILEILNEREMRGVLGHEISRVAHRDILIASAAAGLASMIMILVDLAQLCALFGFGYGGNDGDSAPGFVQIVLIAVLGHSPPLRSRLRAAGPTNPPRTPQQPTSPAIR